MSQRKLEVSFFAVRWLAIIAVIALLHFQSGYPQLPSSLILAIVAYPLLGVAALIVNPDLSYLFLVLDPFAILALCLAGGPTIYSWFFVLPLMSGSLKPSRWTLSMGTIILAMMVFLQFVPL